MSKEPLKVTAHLCAGFSSADDWSPALDGLLAYWLLRRADPDTFLEDQARSDRMVPVEGLPLQRVEWGGLAWWACSSPIYTQHEQYYRHYHRRFDDHYERFLPENTRTVLTSAGPYKAYRRALLQRVTNAVSWHCIGDEGEMRRLLTHCYHIGAKGGQGCGKVKRWDFEPGDAHLAMTHRPLPVAYARSQGITGPILRWGVRPPARIAANQTECVMPCPAS